ncbi:hypothetical protein ACFE04_023740 [Oxalis oulophora]
MEEEKNINNNRFPKINCIVKFGGAAITCKNDFEKIDDENLETVSLQLRQAMIPPGSSKVVGMDWSKRPGVGVVDVTKIDDFEDQPNDNSGKFVVVHGAGSFGHFQASKSGVHKGGLDQPLVKAGFVATRISVTTLNLEIVRALAREGIASIGMSPFSCGWLTSKRNMASANLSSVASAIEAGFIPVLHGDAVLDEVQGCTILSGDVIIRHLAEHLKPDYVVFLVSFLSVQCQWFKHLTESASMAIENSKTDVLGVYDRPPTEPDAVLLREIAVDEDGSWSVLRPTLEEEVQITVAAHDTTGGMVTKISEAAMIAKLGIDVYIVKAATTHSLRAMSGELRDNIPDDWLGTVIRFKNI